MIFTGRNEVVAKVMFLHVCVILFTGGGGSLGRPPRTWQGEPPPPDQPPGTWQGESPPRPTPLGPGRENPPPRTRQTPSRDLAGRNPPRPGRHPPGTWQGEHPPPPRPGRPPPRREEDCSIRSMSGRYASYWNAFLY